jgi:hypothetical protein
MSVIVKGMEMPKCCAFCEIQHDGVCQMNTVESIDDIAYDGRPDWCPLVELPKHHGDLIDRQKLLEDNKHLEYPTDGKYRSDRAWSVGFNAGAKHCNEHAVYAKTVIEAEGVEG